MKKIFLLVIMIMLFVFVGCNNNNDSTKKEVKLSYNSEAYVGDIINIEIIEGNDSIIALETENFDLFDFEDDNAVKAIKEGVGIITVKFEDSDDQIITINITKKPKPTIDFVILENPEIFKMGITYHYEVNITGKADATYEIIKYSNDIILNEEEKTILFMSAGRKNIDCYIVGDRGIDDDVYFDVNPNEDIEYYSIMYIGNSFTFYKSSIGNIDIPDMVKEMIKEHTEYVYIKKSLPFDQYLHESILRFNTHFDGEYFTHVILQDNSGNVVNNFNDFRQSVLKYSQKIDRSKMEIFLYQTWVDYIGTTTADRNRQETIINGYNSVGSEIDAKVIRVGEAFWKANEFDDVPYLYVEDNHHQNIYGQYLSACMHYCMITGRRASDTNYIPEGISEEIAKTIRSIADSFYDN